jgi:hypothetical protein
MDNGCETYCSVQTEKNPFLKSMEILTLAMEIFSTSEQVNYQLTA